MCVRGPQKTPIEVAIEKLARLSQVPKVKNHINFAHAVNYVIGQLEQNDAMTPEALERVRDNFSHITRQMGKKSGVVEYNKILDKLDEQLRAVNPTPPLMMSQPLGVGSDKINGVGEMIEEESPQAQRKNRCC